MYLKVSVCPRICPTTTFQSSQKNAVNQIAACIIKNKPDNTNYSEKECMYVTGIRRDCNNKKKI